MYTFNLKIKPVDFNKYASNYEYQTDTMLDDLSTSAKEKKYLTKPEFLKICAWKTPRSKPLCASNSEGLIKEVTNIALTTSNDQVRIEILTLLKGVNWPTASVILHFCHQDKFPIIDFRALFTLGYKEPPKYDYPFWQAYTTFCRNLSQQFNCDMRAVDRALWQYSKVHQK